MSLRLRLIVAFFALSVLPLGAVTIFTYTSNVKAVQDAAAREADLLAGELTQRMALLTTQLSERVEHVMDLQAATQAAQAAAAKPASETHALPSTQLTVTSVDQRVAQALGEAAMLLNTVELPGFRGFGPDNRQGRSQPRGGGAGAAGGAGRGTGAGGRGANALGNQGSAPGGRGDRPPRTNPVAQSGASTMQTPVPPATGAMPAMPNRVLTVPGRGSRDGAAPMPPPGQPSGAPPPGAPPPPGSYIVTSGTEANDFKIDLRPIRSQLYQQLIPSGQFENLTQEQRQAIAREVNSTMLGIVQGIHLSAAELQKKAAEAQATAAGMKATTAIASASNSTPGATGTTSVVVKPGAPNAEVKTEVTPAPAQTRRKTALTGNRLDVSVEENGKVIRQANAELNLQNVLQTVFSTTRTDRGEVPFAVAKDGTLYTPTDADKAKIAGLGGALKPEGPPTKTTNAGEWIVVTTSDPSGSGLRFGIARPVGDSMNTLRRTAARNASFGLLFIGLAIVGIVPLSGRLTRNLSLLIDGVGRIAQGDFRTPVPVKSQDEIGRLAGAFNQMAADVEKHQHAAVEQERIRRELELGRQIQHEMLPRAPMRLGLTEIQGVSVPAREVGGDFFNYFEVGDGQIALLVGDVSGKGVGAALLMANIQASLRTRLSLGKDLSAIADAIDRDIEENTPGPVYATLFVGILDPAARKLRYVNAGHHPQYVIRHGGGLERMASTGLPVGLFAGRGYREREVQLGAGDVIFFYTDGCVEAENVAGDMFGADRLEGLLTSAPVLDSASLLLRVEAAMKQFRGGVEPFDDETMMGVRVG